VIDWKTITAGSKPVIATKEGCEYPDESGGFTVEFTLHDFAGANWIKVPSNFPGSEAGQQLRVTTSFRQECPCCGVVSTHLHAGSVGVIECVGSGEFKYYRVPRGES